MSDYYAGRRAAVRAMYPRPARDAGTSQRISIPLNCLTETRGTLYYWNGAEVVSLQGWFRLADDGRTILARKPRGTWVWQVANMDDATAFYAGA